MESSKPDPWSARIDFTAVLGDIAYQLGDPAPGQNPDLKVPVSQEKLADHLQVARGTLRGWIDGSEPRHADGEKLLATWSRLTGKARTFAPVDRFVYSASKAGTTAPIRTTNSDKPKAAGGMLHAVCMRWTG